MSAFIYLLDCLFLGRPITQWHVALRCAHVDEEGKRCTQAFWTHDCQASRGAHDCFGPVMWAEAVGKLAPDTARLRDASKTAVCPTCGFDDSANPWTTRLHPLGREWGRELA